MLQTCGVPVERLNDGRPILARTDLWWENGVVFNAAAIFLDHSPANAPMLRRILGAPRLDDPRAQDGVVAVHYRARPEEDRDSALTRSFVGLAVFSPQFELLKRHDTPVLFPTADDGGYDYLGVEDPRITRIGDVFYMVYCGVAKHPEYTIQTHLCMAVSRDLVHWEKLPLLRGDFSAANNKDGVLFPEPVDGRYFLLHRPFGPHFTMTNLAIHLATSDAATGAWKNCGPILHPFENPACKDSWVGAGSVPIRIDATRYLLLYHTGNQLEGGGLEYDIDAALLDLSAFEPRHPERIVRGRLEHLMVPERDAELTGPSKESVRNVLFVCGSYERDGFIYLIYGGADTCLLAARVDKALLVSRIEAAGTVNPFN